MKKSFLISIFAILTFYGNGQVQNLIDSLENKISSLKENPSDSTYYLWLSYYDLVDEYERLSQPDVALNAFEESLKYAPNDTFKFQSYYRRIVWFAEQHNPEMTMSLATKMLKALPDYREAKTSAYMFMAVAHEHRKDPVNAIKYYEKSMASAIESQDSSSYYMVMMNMANTIFDSGDKEKAIKLYKSGVAFYSKVPGSHQQTLGLLNNIGTGYMGVNSDSVFKYLNEVKR